MDYSLSSHEHIPQSLFAGSLKPNVKWKTRMNLSVKEQSEDSDAESGNKSDANLDADVRDIRYNLETLSCDRMCCGLHWFVLRSERYWNKLSTFIEHQVLYDFFLFSLHAQERSECKRTGIECEEHHMGVCQGALVEYMKSFKYFEAVLSKSIFISKCHDPQTNLTKGAWNIWYRHWLSNSAHTKDSVYGRRDAAINGIAIVHQDRGNIYRRSVLWKQGVIDDVQMLPRSEMYKPEVGWWCKMCKTYVDIIANLVYLQSHGPLIQKS